MKILYIFLHNYHDMPYHTREWVEAAIQLGHEVRVVTAIDEKFLVKINWQEQVHVTQVPYPGSGVSNYVKLLKNFRHKIQQEICDFSPDIIYERFSNISLAGAKIAAKHKIPYATEINGIIDEELKLNGASFLRRRFLREIQKRVFMQATKIFTVTEGIEKWLTQSFNVATGKVITIPNGVNVNRFKPQDKQQARTKFNIPPHSLVVGFLGSLFPWCGLERLIRAAPNIISKIPQVLFVIGGGQEPVKSELIKLTEELNVTDYFHFQGQVPWQDAPEFISAFDVAIETKTNSPKTSFSPLKVFAYMACGIPLICPNISSITEVINIKECGFLFANEQELTDVIIKLSLMGKDKLHSFGENARNFVHQNCTWEKRVADTLKHINTKD